MRRARGSTLNESENISMRPNVGRPLATNRAKLVSVNDENSKVVAGPRAALGDIGNRLCNRTLPAGGLKKSTAENVEVKNVNVEGVLKALKKIEPRQPLRATSSVRVPPVVAPKPVAVPVHRLAAKSGSVQNLGHEETQNRHQAAVRVAAKPKLTRTNSVVIVSKTSAAEVAKKPISAEQGKGATSNRPLSVHIHSTCSTIAVSETTAKVQREQHEEDIVVSTDVTAIKTSDAYSTAMIPNIDEEDEANPQLVTDFVNEIYDYLRFLEQQQCVKENYLYGQEISGRMRGVLIDWLVQVHVRFHLLPETLYMTAMLIDRFLQEKAVPKEHLQLVGVTAMFVASKYEEMYAPEIGDFVYITDNTYSKEEIRHMERTILQTLNFCLGKPLPIHFLRRYSKAADADPMKHTLAKYFMELSLTEYSMCHFPPSAVAASSLWLSLKLLKEKWTPTLVYYTKYTESEIMPVIKVLGSVVLKVHSDKSKLQAVRNKFMTTKFMEISRNACLDLVFIQELVKS